MFSNFHQIPAHVIQIAMHPDKSAFPDFVATAAAQETAQEHWTARLEAAKELESAGVTLIEKRIAGEAGSEYRRSREQFISLIHTWFAQLCLLTEEVPLELMPNPEILPDPEKVKKLFTQERARRMLDAAENLLAALNTNVNDELALRTFCLSINLMLRKKPVK